MHLINKTLLLFLHFYDSFFVRFSFQKNNTYNTGKVNGDQAAEM